MLARALETLGQVLFARTDVDADLARVGVLRREAVDGVRHPALLADLLEQARGGGAAENAVKERGGEPPPVGARDPGGSQADVVLLGVLALEAQARRGRLDERPPHPRPLRLRRVQRL